MGMPYIGINVSDVEASVSFYRRFGYKSVRWINEQTLSRRNPRHGVSISRSGTVALMWPLSAVIITGFAFAMDRALRSRSGIPAANQP